mmetsp:Transcript_30091/g.58016  ORF Transcript_30091/g.58016 Transcript_30091/m.58016 type:complete len:86 (-) Transcript_30091:171-428(-)
MSAGRFDGNVEGAVTGVAGLGGAMRPESGLMDAKSAGAHGMGCVWTDRGIASIGEVLKLSGIRGPPAAVYAICRKFWPERHPGPG